MKPSRSEWADAFHAQARSDWAVYEQLGVASLPACHRLHYLQMACEKLAKAYRLRGTEADEEELRKHHVGFVSSINTWMRSPAIRERYPGREAQREKVARQVAAVARLIEGLAPAADRGNTPEDVEYPWRDGARVVVPCNFTFPVEETLAGHEGRHFLKLVKLALDLF